MNKKLISLSFAAIVFLAGCARPYQIRPLKHVRKQDAQFCEKKDNIEVRVKKLTHQEVKDTFDGHYFSKYITMLLMTVKNNSRETIHINQNDINLTLLSAQDLESRVSESILGRIISGVFALPTILYATLYTIAPFCGHGCCCCAPSPVLSWIIFLECFVGLPLAVGYSIEHAANFNALISHDLETKVLSELSIAPGEKQSRLLATKELQQPFTTALTNKEHTTIFNVTLKDSANTLPDYSSGC